MTACLSQINLFAQRNGSGDWVNLLIPLVLIVVSVIGGLIKRFAQPKQHTAGEEPVQPSRKDRQASDWRRRLEERLEQWQRQETRSDAPEAQDAPRSRRESIVIAPTPVRQSPMSEQGRMVTEAATAAQDVVAADLQATEPPGEPPNSAVRSPSVPVGGKALVDLNDPDGLTRAILQYEILGKPLALRDAPFERL